MKSVSKHNEVDLYAQQLKKINLRDKLQQLNKVTSDVEMRVLFAKRAKELSAERQERLQYDYEKEKSIEANVRQGQSFNSAEDFNQLSRTRAKFDSYGGIQKKVPGITNSGTKTVPRSCTPDQGDKSNNSRPATVNTGRRIFESQFYMS